MNLTYILSEPSIQAVLNCEDFFFQKGQDALKRWLQYPLSDLLKEDVLHLASDYTEIQVQAKQRPDIDEILQLLFEIISYCDIKARDKNFYNEYDDERALGMAFVRMNHWIEKLIIFKLTPESLESGSPKNAFEYLLIPENNVTILSENHRALIAENLLKVPYIAKYFVNDLEDFFKENEIKIANRINYTHLLSRIVYGIEKEWKEEVIALMASDGTDWKDDHIANKFNYDTSIIWNSKRPSGVSKTLNFLQNVIKERGYFHLYYSDHGLVRYKATIIDFSQNQQELDNKNWSNKYNIAYYEPSFADYYDDNKKANIIFLVSSFEKIIPVPVASFKFAKPYSSPVQDNLSPVIFEPETQKLIMPEKHLGFNEIYAKTTPLNQILFGPPGTGKTYVTIAKSLAILGNENLEGKKRTEIKTLFDEKQRDGQIVFTTFHQSLSYEDFIEGIKPLVPKNDGDPVVYKVKDGIFKVLALEAKKNFDLSQVRHGISNVPFDSLFDQLKQKVDDALLNDPVEIPNEKKKGLVLDLPTSFFSITSIVGSSIKMMTRTGNEQNTMTKPTLKLIYETPDKIEEIVAGGMKVYYKALVLEMKKWERDVFSSAETVDLRNYVLIIDEINRGNVSQIFGELITLIEDNKRYGQPEELRITLPYSNDEFVVPPNLYIIGTMNTADRSVEALDAALRRRFSFEEVLPDYSLEQLQYNYVDTKVADILKAINSRIEKLLDKDHQIGHSYFIKKDDESAEEKLINAFYKNIIPLLQEYFFGDYGKIGLVLGKGFIRLKDSGNGQNLFADFDHSSVSDFDERELFEIVDYRRPTASYMIKINGKDIEMDFSKALQLLMKQPIA